MTDTTDIRPLDGVLYLCRAIDVFSCRVVGWSAQSRMISVLEATSDHPAASCPDNRAKVLATMVKIKRQNGLLAAAIDGLGHTTDGVGLAENLLDLSAVLDRLGTTLVPGRSAVDH